MSIEVMCQKCGDELNHKGALVFGPPRVENGVDVTPKFHICQKCWSWLIHWLWSGP